MAEHGQVTITPETHATPVTDELERLNAAASAVGRSLAEAAEAMRPGIEQFGRNLAHLARILHPDVLARSNHAWSLLFLTARDRQRHRRRCSTCNPYGNPKPQLGHYKPGPKAARIRRRPR